MARYGAAADLPAWILLRQNRLTTKGPTTEHSFLSWSTSTEVGGEERTPAAHLYSERALKWSRHPLSRCVRNRRPNGWELADGSVQRGGQVRTRRGPGESCPTFLRFWSLDAVHTGKKTSAHVNEPCRCPIHMCCAGSTGGCDDCLPTERPGLLGHVGPDG